MGYEVLETQGRLREVHTRGAGFIFNDSWLTLHKASCWTVPLSAARTGSPADIDAGTARGQKLLWLDVKEARAWIRGHRKRTSYGPKDCTRCNPSSVRRPARR